MRLKILRIILIAIILFSICAYYLHLHSSTSSKQNNTENTQSTQNTSKTAVKKSGLIYALTDSYPAPSLAIGTWINSKPLTLSQLKGKVVLIDFWTYSYIHCIRTLPYLIAWDKKYRDKGLVIIGVHTPEFAFEKNPNNVKKAVLHEGIQYPVLLDNEYITWQNFHNQYWPAHYLINQKGYVVSEHFGESSYETTEHNIRTLLGMNTEEINNTVPKNAHTFFHPQTPEIYFGDTRTEHFASPEDITENNRENYTFPTYLSANQWALHGQWLINTENIVATAPQTAIKINFYAKHAYMVAGSMDAKPIKIHVLLNGAPVTHHAGSDVKNSILTISNQRLYQIIDFPEAADAEMTLIIDRPGVMLYTFTFG